VFVVSIVIVVVNKCFWSLSPDDTMQCKSQLCLFEGIPLIYELSNDLKPLKHYYTASDAEVQAAIDKVAAQGKAAPPAK